MAINIPPPPIHERDFSNNWKLWFSRLREILSTVSTFSWTLIDFTGSNITDIISRSHQDLQNLQGGSSSERYHLSVAQVTKLDNLQDTTLVTSTAVDMTLDQNAFTVYVTATGKTITLPAAATGIVGKTWTVILATTGNVTITRQGSDTIVLPTTDTSVIMYNKGDSLSFRCISSTSWAIV